MKQHQHPANAGASSIDPVCGMSVDPKTTKHHAEHAGHIYHFCSAGCREKFNADPQRYLDDTAGEPDEAAPAGTIYTCPMHPEVQQVGPGNCPKQSVLGRHHPMAMHPGGHVARIRRDHRIVRRLRRE